MKDILVLVTGFASGLMLWVGAYDFVAARHKRGRTAAQTELWRGIGRVCMAIWTALLAYAISISPRDPAVSWITVVYLGASVGILVSSVGLIVTKDWTKPVDDNE